MFNTYSEFSDSISSEKLTLAIVEASKRLVNWTLHSGSIYKKTNQDFQVISEISVNGIALTQVYDLSDVIAGKYYNDRENNVLYLRLLDSSNPDNSFIHVTFKLFYANAGIDLPHDLNTGFDVHWEGLIDSTSKFGVGIDTINQNGDAIEGSGTLTLLNDQEFWPANFDKLFFDNKNIYIYSHNRQLPASEAKLLFKGKIESKSYTSQKITLTAKDLISQLRNSVALTDISDLVNSGYRPLPSEYKSKQRMIFGRVKGHRPTNVDCVVDSRYPLTGTISVTNLSTTVTGSGTSFRTELSPDDRLDISGVIYTISSITNDTTLILTEVYASTSASGLTIDFLPALSKRFINREWCVAGHSLCQPTVTALAGSSTLILNVSSTANIYSGDRIYVGSLGSGNLVTVGSVSNNNLIVLATSLPTIPPAGTTVFKPAIQNLRINETELIFERDFSINASTGILTLTNDAEINAGETRQSIQQATFTNGSYSVTGSGTSFKSVFKPGYVIRPSGVAEWYEILYVNSDTSMSLRTPFSTTTETDYVQYKSLVFNPSEHVLTCEVLGRTDNGTSTGNLLIKAPDVVEQLLKDAGLTNDINTSTFNTANNILIEDVGFVIPVKFNEKKSFTYRDIINNVNKSVLGILYQGDDFLLGYDVLRPLVPVTMTRFEDADMLDLKVSSTNKNMVKTVRTNYQSKEWDYTSFDANYEQVIKQSDISTYIVKTEKEKVIDTVLVNQTDAQRLCDRWSFLLEFSTNIVTIRTKLNASSLEINDIIDINSRKMFDRFGGVSSRKIVAIERIQKSGNEVVIDAVDLSNAFNRISKVSNDDTTIWAESTEDTKLISGFISNDSGLIGSDDETVFLNKIW